MKSQYVLPVTIIVAGLLIAGAVFLVGKVNVPTNGNASTTVTAREYDPSIDHILGNPGAAVKVVEYMDLECPHCKTFEGTMNQVMSYYGASGNVAWVQRPFPLGSIHSKAPKEAEGAECAADLGGNTAYWQFVEKVFEVTPSNNGLDLAQLPIIAQGIGLDVNAFNTCLNSGKYTKKITDSYNEALALGAQGTPFTLIMVGGEAVTLAGNQPYDSMRAAIDAVLQGNPAVQNASTTAQ
ncbi:MAG TPA: thioredoxin domain-containing protein [Candidatus Paceibacterota bacterium]|nr:thioredoxin domain-containing protein [Candidatus Paceibacterota bacterium]